MQAPPLTPAEAFVLLDPNRSSPSEAFKIVFLSLVAQGVLKVDLVDTRKLLRTRKTPIVSVIREPPGTLLAAEVVKVVRHAIPSAKGIQLDDISRSALKLFGVALIKLKTEFVLPALSARNLLGGGIVRALWVLKLLKYTHTPEGLAEKQRIETMLAQARQLPALLKSNPEEARAIVLAAGSLLLLIPELKAHYGQLAALDPAALSGPDGSDFAWAGGGDDTPGHHPFASFDFGSFDVGALDMDFGSFDASFDSSFGDSSGDSGGDSGVSSSD